MRCAFEDRVYSRCDPCQIGQRVGDVRLAQQPCGLGGDGRRPDPDRPAGHGG
ncbi:MAG: hypothetical protein ACRDOE_08375 [Streptosporangiaceae bacterium]